MRCEDDTRLLLGDLRDDLVHRRWLKRCCRIISRPARHQNMFFRRQLACLEYLRPAIREPSVPDHHHRLVFSQLPRDGLHRIGSATGNQRHAISAIDLLQHRRDVTHHALEHPAHVIERAVGEHHREFQQSVGVDILS